MTSTCISNCVKDARVPVRATYVNLYKWPESDVEFIRSLSSDKRKTTVGGHHHFHHPKVVDSISCRQLYLRSYTFSRDDDDDKNEKKKESSRRTIRDSAASKTTSRRKRRSKKSTISSKESGDINNVNSGRNRRTRRRKYEGIRRAKEASCATLAAIFRRLLFCTTKIDVVRWL